MENSYMTAQYCLPSFAVGPSELQTVVVSPQGVEPRVFSWMPRQDEQSICFLRNSALGVQRPLRPDGSCTCFIGITFLLAVESQVQDLPQRYATKKVRELCGNIRLVFTLASLFLHERS